MDIHNANLNIHYTAPKEIWDKLAALYPTLPHWRGSVDGCPTWFGTEGRHIELSVEPSGLQLYATLPQAEWEAWLASFKQKATEIMGYPIGEPEDGFDFVLYEA